MGNQVINNIVFIRSDRLGEFLLSLYALVLVRSNHPQARIYLVAQKDNLALIRGIDCVDNYIEYNERAFSGFSGALRLAGVLKKAACDCVVVLNPKKEFHLAALLSRASLRVGYDRKWSFCLNRKIRDEKARGEKPEAEYNLDLVRSLCAKQEIPSISMSLDSRASLDFLHDTVDCTKKYIVLHPFTSHTPKKIERDFWVALAASLRAKVGQDIVLIGSSEEREESDALASAAGVGNLTGMLSLRNLAVFLKYNCRAFIGLDSGPMHLASIFKVPVVALFRSSNEKRWGPYRTQSIVVRGADTAAFKDRIDQILSFVARQV